MAKRATKYEYKSQEYSYDIKPGESEEHYFKRVMWAADKRLQRLEKLSQQEGFENVLNYAYKTAMRDIEIYSGEGHTKFGQKVPEVQSIKNEKLAAALHFLGSATSSVSSIKKMYKQRAQTLSGQLGIDISWNELADVVEAFHAEESGGSPTKMKAIGVIKSIKKEGFEKALKKNKHMKSEVVMGLVEHYMKSKDSQSLRDIMNISEEDALAILEEISQRRGK